MRKHEIRGFFKLAALSAIFTVFLGLANAGTSTTPVSLQMNAEVMTCGLNVNQSSWNFGTLGWGQLSSPTGIMVSNPTGTTQAATEVYLQDAGWYNSQQGSGFRSAGSGTLWSTSPTGTYALDPTGTQFDTGINLQPGSSAPLYFEVQLPTAASTSQWPGVYADTLSIVSSC